MPRRDVHDIEEDRSGERLLVLDSADNAECPSERLFFLGFSNRARLLFIEACDDGRY